MAMFYLELPLSTENYIFKVGVMPGARGLNIRVPHKEVIFNYAIYFGSKKCQFVKLFNSTF